MLLRRVGKSLGPAAGVGHPRTFAAPSFPWGLVGSFSIGEVGNGLILAQPPRRAVLGGNETSSCICLHQKCTHRCKPEPTHARISAPTRACTRIGAPKLTHTHRQGCKHACMVGARARQCPVAHPTRPNPALLFPSRGKAAAHQAACSSGPECCLLLPALSLPRSHPPGPVTQPCWLSPTQNAAQTPTTGTGD